jgi:hypothetical protein
MEERASQGRRQIVLLLSIGSLALLGWWFNQHRQSDEEAAARDLAAATLPRVHEPVPVAGSAPELAEPQPTAAAPEPPLDWTKRFVVSPRGTVYDKDTKLTWQQSTPSERVTQQAAIDYCKKLRLEGGGWHLPTRAEMQTIAEPRLVVPDSPNPFPLADDDGFWTATADPDNAGSGFAYDFFGVWASLEVSDADPRARCVRGRQRTSLGQH